ncbi:MAG: thioesterase family protein [Pseudomonadota bacterium]|nr:thioesterase family protein [Pseudomonadota bacterium]
MYPWLRAAGVAARALASPVDPAQQQPLALALRVWPNDCDANLHLNNGRYLTLADLGRMDFFLRHRWWRRLAGRRWNVVATSVHVLYRRSLDLGQRYRLVTQIAGTNERFLLMEQRFQRQGRTCCILYVSIGVIDSRGLVAIEDVRTALGVALPAPPHAAELARQVDIAILDDLDGTST